jgi:DNA-binding transcriptional MerR regulator
MASDDGLLTIDALARRTRLTARNIRSYQSRGLLPPPKVRGRTGYYGPEHIARLEVIQEMQADGFNLAAIKRLLEGAGGAWEVALGFKRAALAPYETESPEVVEGDELLERLGGTVDPKLVQKAIDLGIVVPLGEGRFELPSPALIRAGEAVLALGVPLETAFGIVEEVLRHSEAVAGLFVDLFLDQVMAPFREADDPEKEWPRVRDAVDRLRPIASETVAAAFAMRMLEATEEAFGRELGQMGGRPSRRRQSGRSRSSPAERTPAARDGRPGSRSSSQRGSTGRTGRRGE